MRNYIWLLLGIACTVSATGYNSVYIMSSKYGQLITSSTLRWVSAEKGTRPDSAVQATEEIVAGETNDADTATGTVDEDTLDEILERPVFVCRGRKNGIWLSGQLRFGKTTCQVSLLGVVYEIEHYEVLENVDNGARLSWVYWDKFHQLLTGAVAVQDSYIARWKIDQGNSEEPKRILGLRHLVGKLDIKEAGFGKVVVISEKDTEEEHESGEVLVETEPVSYELTGLKFNYFRKKVKRHPCILGQAVLKNEASNGPMRVDTVIAYETNFSKYWGQGRAMLTGLPTIIKPNSTIIRDDIKWGIQETEEHKDVHKVETTLQPGTAVNVTLHGNFTDTETPYSGKLIAVYGDLQTRARTIHSSLREIGMKDVTPIFGPVYWLHNNSLVPTTTTTTTSTTTTTTTSTTTTTTTQHPNKNDNSAHRNESFYSVEQNGAQSLKNNHSTLNEKSEGVLTGGSSGLHSYSILIYIFAAMVVIHRIT